MSRLFSFEQERRTTVVANEPGDLLTSRQVTFEITKNASDEVLAFDSVLRRSDPPGVEIGLRCQRLGGVVKQSREDQNDLFVRCQ